MANEAHISDDKSKKAMVDAARLADELRNEQELAQDFEKCRKLLECQLKDMQGRLDEAETNALKVLSSLSKTIKETVYNNHPVDFRVERRQ